MSNDCDALIWRTLDVGTSIPMRSVPTRVDRLYLGRRGLKAEGYTSYSELVNVTPCLELPAIFVVGFLIGRISL